MHLQSSVLEQLLTDHIPCRRLAIRGYSKIPWLLEEQLEGHFLIIVIKIEQSFGPTGSDIQSFLYR